MEYLYSALLLHKLGKEVNEESVKKVIAAAGVDVDESKVKTLVASLKGVDITAELENASAMVTTGATGAASGGAAESEEKKEEKKEEEKPVESAAGLSSLFG